MALVLAAGAFVDTDHETAELLIKLQLEDLEELIQQSDRKGKGKPGVMTDSQFTFTFQKKELTKNLQFLQDRHMTRSMARAVLSDAVLLAANNEEERVAISDRAMAHRLAGKPVPNPVQNAPAACVNDRMEVELIEKLGALYVDDIFSDTASTINISVAGSSVYDEGGESSAWATSRQVSKLETRECIMCGEDVSFRDIARLDCKHECCQTCLTEMFKASIVSEDRYPPKCCDAIEPHDTGVHILLSSVIVKDFDTKKIEWDSKNRVYCSNRDCRTFIAPDNIIADHACCLVCNCMTCSICKQPDHEGDCPDDEEELKKTLKLIEDEGWRRCKSCNLAFDLLHGCNHITCPKPCGAEFCYVCGKAWKTCNCPTWDENNLLHRANHIANRRQDLGEADRQRIADRAVAQLARVGHCKHKRGFLHRRYGAICERCNFEAPDFIFECRTCATLMCRNCSGEI